MKYHLCKKCKSDWLITEGQGTVTWEGCPFCDSNQFEKEIDKLKSSELLNLLRNGGIPIKDYDTLLSNVRGILYFPPKSYNINPIVKKLENSKEKIK